MTNASVRVRLSSAETGRILAHVARLLAPTALAQPITAAILTQETA